MIMKIMHREWENKRINRKSFYYLCLKIECNICKGLEFIDFIFLRKTKYIEFI
jgi:hypothetical protein